MGDSMTYGIFMIVFCGSFLLVGVVMAAPALYQFLWGDFADERRAEDYVRRVMGEKRKRKEK